jgi:FkbM family methyltransferase
MLRTLAEKMSRNRRVIRRLPSGLRIYVSPDSQLKYLKSQFDADLTALAAEFVRPDSVVWDIGANCGVFAFSAAAARFVLAVEADPFLANLVSESSLMNQADVTVLCCAVTDGSGFAEFVIASRGRASNHLVGSGHSQTGGERARIAVPTVSLDMLMDRFGMPDLVKIDVEGGEPAVLRGASRLLAARRTRFYIEITEDSQAEVAALFAAQGYVLKAGGELNWLAEPNSRNGKAT